MEMKPIEFHRNRPLYALMMVLAMLVILALGACNTTRGLGEDVEAAGEGIQEAAEEVEEEIED
jgi:entericidin B